jgi:hypothetical protein
VSATTTFGPTVVGPDNEEGVTVRDSWQPVLELIEVVTGDVDVIEQAVRDVRTNVPDVGRLPSEEIARHTRALMAAAVRAIAERRGPTAAELDFIEDLAVARARQQIPIQIGADRGPRGLPARLVASPNAGGGPRRVVGAAAGRS